MECGFVAMQFTPTGPGRTLAFLVLFFAVFACYVLAVRQVLGRADGTGWTIVGLACLFRLTFVFAAPVLSDDLQRYLWDGRVTLDGGNPYIAFPASPAGAARGDADIGPLAHKEVATVYPPAAQLLFAGGAALGPGIYGIKILVVLLDLLVIAVLRALLRERGRPGLRVLIYAWNPLAVTETAWSGHIEPAATLCVLLAAVWIIQKREAGATFALAAGGLVKFVPLILIAPLLRRIRARHLPIVPVAVTLAYWPFRAAGRLLFAGLREYADRWLGNESLFGIVHAAIVWMNPTPGLKAAIACVRRSVPHTSGLDRLYGYVYPIDLAKGACALAVLGFAAWLVRRDVEPLRGLYWMTGALLLLSPTAHPWYFLWVLPWLCLFPSPPWILLSGLVALAYANLGASGRAGEPYPWIRLAEYGPFYCLAGAGWLRARLRVRRGIGGAAAAGTVDDSGRGRAACIARPAPR